jgi:hypothetical protein
MLAAGVLLLAAAAVAREPQRAELAYVEVSFTTHAGEGAQGVKRFFRDGCFAVASEGGTGGGRARESSAGCHLRRDVDETFAKLDALVKSGDVVRERDAPGTNEGGAAGHLVSERAVLVGKDGARWVAASQLGRMSLEGAIAALPSENLWFPPMPADPPGRGAPVLVAISWSRPGAGGARRLQASLVDDGRWWCARSTGARGGDGAENPARPPRALAAAEAKARLGRILRGVRRPADGDAEAKPAAGDEAVSVEVAFADGLRDAVRPRSLTRTVADRFLAELRAQSPACAAP